MAALSEILKEMNDNVKVQILRDSIVKVVDKKRTADTEVTFATNEINCNSIDGDKVGVVIWFSKEEYNMAIKNLMTGEFTGP
jgi:hypothetical protein